MRTSASSENLNKLTPCLPRPLRRTTGNKVDV